VEPVTVVPGPALVPVRRGPRACVIE